MTNTNHVYDNMQARMAGTGSFNTIRTDLNLKKTFVQLREQAFRLADAADPEWKSPRAMRILAIYMQLGKKYLW